MGYEVLDSRGDSAVGPAEEWPTDGAPDDHAQDDVIDLTDPAHPHGRPAQKALATTGPSRVRAGGDRRTALIVALSLITGGLGGAALNQRHDNLAAQARDRAAFAVSAQATTVSAFALQIGVGARLKVKVTNLGPMPVDVMDTATFGGPPSTRAPMVTMLGGGTSVAPGTSALVEMRVSIDCRPGRTLSARLPVRTADGAEHRLAVTLPDDPMVLCPGVAEPSILEASVTGSVLRPALRLWNNTEQPLRVSLLPVGLSPEAANAVISVVPTPALPRTIGPHEELTVRLRFMARSCVAELQDLRALENATLRLSSQQLTPTAPIPAGQVAVDVTAVIAATMVRACG